MMISSLSRTERTADLKRIFKVRHDLNQLELPDLGGADPTSGAFAMTISSLLRTERTADLRWIFKVRQDLNQLELDSHADTCAAGANSRVTDYTDTKVSESPFSDSCEAIKDIPIATVAMAWDDPATGDMTVLCAAGANTRVMDYTNTKVNVSPFSDSYQAIKDVPIAMVATAWDNPETGEVIVLNIHEGSLLRGQDFPHATMPESASSQWMDGPGCAKAVRCGVSASYHQSYWSFADNF
jgi:hypothetical protein